MVSGFIRGTALMYLCSLLLSDKNNGEFMEYSCIESDQNNGGNEDEDKYLFEFSYHPDEGSNGVGRVRVYNYPLSGDGEQLPLYTVDVNRWLLWEYFTQISEGRIAPETIGGDRWLRTS